MRKYNNTRVSKSTTIDSSYQKVLFDSRLVREGIIGLSVIKKQVGKIKNADESFEGLRGISRNIPFKSL